MATRSFGGQSGRASGCRVGAVVRLSPPSLSTASRAAQRTRLASAESVSAERRLADASYLNASYQSYPVGECSYVVAEYDSEAARLAYEDASYPMPPLGAPERVLAHGEAMRAHETYLAANHLARVVRQSSQSRDAAHGGARR